MDNDENNNQPPPPTSVYPHNSAITTVIPPPPTSGSTSIIPGVGATYNHQQQQYLQYFWSGQRQDIERVNDFKNHQLPLARIKKIMKADEDVRMISAEAPILFAKACELFILELTIRSWHHAEENKRRTLQKNDIAASITRTEIFDFLVDIVPREEIKEEEDAAAAVALGGGSMVAQAATGVPYYFPPMGVPGGMMIGRPAMDPTGFYAQPPSHAWQNSGGGGGGSGVDDVSYGSGASNNGGHGNLDSQI